MSEKELKILHIENRLALLRGRGEYNMKLINKLERQLRLAKEN